MAYKLTATPADVVDLLNEALRLDSDAITALVCTRVPCNAALADHHTIQVGQRQQTYWVGLLGIINGLFALDEETGWGAVAAVINGDQVEQFVLTQQVKAAETPCIVPGKLEAAMYEALARLQNGAGREAWQEIEPDDLHDLIIAVEGELKKGATAVDLGAQGSEV